jgi:hypothetical protein
MYALLFFILLLLPTHLISGVVINGDGYRIRANIDEPISTGHRFGINDTIHTRGKELELRFNDGGKAILSVASQLVITNYSRNNVQYTTMYGRIKWESGNTVKNGGVAMVRTPTAILTLRGTHFITDVNEIGDTDVILLKECESFFSPVNSCYVGTISISNSGHEIKIVDTADVKITIRDGNIITVDLNEDVLDTPEIDLINETNDGKKETSLPRIIKKPEESIIHLKIGTTNKAVNVNDEYWLYTSTSESNTEFTSIKIPFESNALLILEQNGIVEGWSSSTPTPAGGTIIIRQRGGK